MKTYRSAFLFIILAFIAVLATSGCSYRSYQEGNTKYTSFAIGTSQAVAPFTLEAGKKDDASYRKLDSKGLTNEPNAEALKAVAEGAVTAAVKAAK
jgi:hypothetical protein